MPSYHFEHTPDGKELRVRFPVAQFDAASVPDFKKALDSAWKPGIARVVLDLATVELIDSSGVGALLSVQKRLPANGEPVTLQRVRPAVAGVLQLLRLQRVFKIV
jgi:anti-sigma B factor antagonist